MHWFRHLKIAAKLTLGFGLLTLIIGFVAYQGWRGLHTINDLVDMVEQHAIGLENLKEADVQLITISRAVRNAILDDDASAVDKRMAEIKTHDTALFSAFAKYQHSIVLPGTKTKAAEVEALLKALP